LDHLKVIFLNNGRLGALTVGIVFAQSVDDFAAWMRTIDEKNQSVQRNIAAKDADAATADAKTLQETFKLVEGLARQRLRCRRAISKGPGAGSRGREGGCGKGLRHSILAVHQDRGDLHRLSSALSAAVIEALWPESRAIIDAQPMFPYCLNRSDKYFIIASRSSGLI
jgi:hypothetical protein